MPPFNIVDHLDKLQPDGGSSNEKGDVSFKCPICDGDNFKVNLTTGKWGCFGCDCASTENGKRQLRAKLSPPANPDQLNGAPEAKSVRPRQRREWLYQDSSGQDCLKVIRVDDGNGARKFWQESLLPNQKPADLVPLAQPYRLVEALKALADGAPCVLWCEGESCADALWELGLPAVTSLGGAGKFKPARDAGHLPPDRLVVCPDRDQPGMAHAHAVADAHPGCRWLLAFPDSPLWQSLPPSGGLDVADWIQDGCTAEQILASIVDELPSPPEAQPSGEAKGIASAQPSFISDATALTTQLKEGLDRIFQLEDDDVRPMAMNTLRRDLGVSKAEFDQLVLMLLRPSAAPTDSNDLSQYRESSQVIIQDFLATGLTLICADGHAGKTSLAYQIAESVALGGRLADTFQATQGNVLIFQKDESGSTAYDKFIHAGIETPRGSITLEWDLNRHRMNYLRRRVKETGAKVVILDALISIAGTDVSPKDAEFAMWLYELERLADELAIAIVILHHTLKSERPVRGATDKYNQFFELSKHDIYGSAFVYNACKDAWMMWSYTMEGCYDPFFALKNVKVRSRVVALNTVYEFSGSNEDDRFICTGARGRTQSLQEGAKKIASVESWLHQQDGRGFTAAEVCRQLQLGNVKYAGNILSTLHQRRDSGIARLKHGPLGVGRPSYIYYSSKGSLQGRRSAHQDQDGEGSAAAVETDRNCENPPNKHWNMDNSANPSHSNGSELTTPPRESLENYQDRGKPPESFSTVLPINHTFSTPTVVNSNPSQREERERVERELSIKSPESHRDATAGSANHGLGPSEMLAHLRSLRQSKLNTQNQAA